VNVYIPIVEIGIFILAYLAVGLFISPFLIVWQFKFLNTKGNPFKGLRKTWILTASFMWPLIVWDCAYSEIKRKKRNK
jgi:hypothetical protein